VKKCAAALACMLLAPLAPLPHSSIVSVRAEGRVSYHYRCALAHYSVGLPLEWHRQKGDCARVARFWSSDRGASVTIAVSKSLGDPRLLRAWLVRRLVGKDRLLGAVTIQQGQQGPIPGIIASARVRTASGMVQHVVGFATIAWSKTYSFDGRVLDERSPTSFTDTLTVDSVLTSLSIDRQGGSATFGN